MTGKSAGQEVLVIGASGYLGQRVTRLLSGRAIPTHRRTPTFPESIPYDFYQDELPPTAVTASTIIFAAAVEMNQPTDKLAAGMKRLLIQVGPRRFVYISSDAVFSGRQGDYTEMDVPDPANAYGRNLVLCEQLVQEMTPDYCIIRPSYIFGFNNGMLDARLARTRQTLEQGERYVAYHDYYKCPLSVHEVADAVVRLAESGYTGPIHVAGPRISAYEFQQRAMTALGVDTANLHPEPMPDSPDLMRDTSLDSSHWWRMRNAQPMSIEDALQVQRE